MSHVQFVAYTGEYPHLCLGILTLQIDGKEIQFGDTPYDPWFPKEKNRYGSFWTSGGKCERCENGLDTDVKIGKWIIMKDSLPDRYHPYYEEIEECFNAHVPYGCCGGCV